MEELFSAEGCLGCRDFSDMLFSGLPAAAELSGEIIPGRAFLCRGMHFEEGNHLWKSFFLRRDAFRRRKSSLGEFFTAEGCISQKEIISGRAFFCRGMHFAEGNHLWKSFFLQRDAFRGRKSSLGEIFLAEGCISQKESIPGRAFHCRGMHFAEGNHLWKSFFLQRDAFRRRKASLEELFPAEGCISQKESIPGRAFLCRGMHFAEGNHLWESFFLQRDAFRRRKSSLGELFSAEGCSAPPNSNP